MRLSDAGSSKASEAIELCRQLQSLRDSIGRDVFSQSVALDAAAFCSAPSALALFDSQGQRIKSGGAPPHSKTQARGLRVNCDAPSVRNVKLYFFRHGKADWPNWDKPDDERPLTEEGKKEVRKVARLLARLEVAPLILTSPLPRASQTAEIAAECLDAKLCEESKLGKGFNAARLREIVKRRGAESLMVVGHEPAFTRTISQLTGAETKLSKAGVALVELDVASMKGELRWLFPPKFARKL
jgi:phosphohistidine phosphatase